MRKDKVKTFIAFTLSLKPQAEKLVRLMPRDFRSLTSGHFPSASQEKVYRQSPNLGPPLKDKVVTARYRTPFVEGTDPLDRSSS